VIDTGEWIGGRQFLFSPQALNQKVWEDHTIQVDLKKDAFEKSPEIDLQQPVSRQALDELHEYFSWPTWLMGTGLQTAYIPITPDILLETAERQAAGKGDNPHLRSSGEVIGYAVRGRNGEIGVLEDFFVGIAEWRLEHFTVNTRSWLPGRKALISTDHIRSIEFGRHEISVDLDRDQIEDCPDYDPREGGSKPFSLAQYRYLGFDPYLIRFTS
jgi:hypothetical protein